MKNFLVAALIITASVVANAGTHFHQYPTVGNVPVNNLCDAGSSFRTLTPVAVCTEWKAGKTTVGMWNGTNYSCVASKNQIVKISKTYETSVCNDSNPAVSGNIEANFPVSCSSETTTTKTHGNTFTVSVMENMGEAGLVVVGTFKHKVPACK